MIGFVKSYILVALSTFYVVIEESLSTTGWKMAATPDSEPLTAQRKMELEHYLKLKRCRTDFFIFDQFLLLELKQSSSVIVSS